MNDEVPDGYAMPLRTSLTRPILLGGVPRAFAILNATIGAALLKLRRCSMLKPLLPLALNGPARSRWAGSTSSASSCRRNKASRSLRS